MSITINHNTNRIGINSTDWISGNTSFNVGIGTTVPTSKLHVVGNVLVSGIVTASSFVGNLSGVAGYATTSGISTVAQGLTGTPNVVLGIATATAFVGDGSGLTNLPSGGSGTSYWVQNNTGIHTLSNIGIGTTNAAAAITIGSTTEIRFTSTNVKIGDAQTGRSITSGNNNNFIGPGAGSSTTTGQFNNFFGQCAGYFNTSGNSNNFLGDCAGRCTTTGSFNNFLGRCAGHNNIGGNFNNFLGYLTGLSNTAGNHDNFLGHTAGYYNTTGCNNNFFGQGSGYSNTSGSDNNFIGCSSGRKNTTGSYNNFFGPRAGYCNTSGIRNNFIGVDAGFCNTTGNYNNFFGYWAGNRNTSGTGNNFVGQFSGFSNATGCNNNFFGVSSGICNTGNYNSFFGHNAGRYNSSGCCNSFFGKEAGYFNSTGSNNVVIGSGRNTPITNGSNQLVIGSGSSDWINGNSSYNVGLGITNPTSKLHIVGNVLVSGVVTATSFYGDGSNLTGISGSGGISYWSSTAAGINTTSNVGVGTTVPTSKLHVVGDVLVSGTGILTATSIDVSGTTRIKNFAETQSSSSISSNILNIDATQGTVFTHTTSSQIGIVSFTGISTARANVQTFTVLVTQGATPVNVTSATGIGTQVATIVTDSGVGINTHIKVGSGSTITLTNSVGALDLLTFVVSYNGVGIASTNFTLIGIAATNFRGVI